MNFKINKNVLFWIESILSERYGLECVLRKDSTDINLEIRNEKGYIKFDVNLPCFNKPCSDFSYTQWHADKEGWDSPFCSPLPAPGLDELVSPLIEQKDGNYLFHYDLIGLIFWMLARVEEIGRNDLDEHSRFPAKSSHAFKHNYLDRPVVDEWLEILGQVISRQWPNVKLKNNHSDIFVSHDVDHPSRFTFCPRNIFFRRLTGDLIKYRRLESFFTAPLARILSSRKISNLDRWNTFEWLMDQTEKNGLQGNFFFQTGISSGSKDCHYKIDSKQIQKLVLRINERGHRVGFHPSYESSFDESKFNQEASLFFEICKNKLKLRQNEWGGRMHYLRCKVPQTSRFWENNNFTYESSLGYADAPGFRCGTCREYKAFDATESIELNLVIKPLIVMECSIFDENNRSIRIANTHLFKIKERCFKVNGTFNILWHNNFFEKKVYKKIFETVIRKP